MTNALEQYKDVIENLGVVVHGLPTGGVQRNMSVTIMGTCLLVDLENDIRCKAERFPVEITGRVTEHWGVRSKDGSVEVFVLKVEGIHAIDARTTPQKKMASMLSLLVKKDANLIVMYDKILRFGCLCGAFTGSRISGERVTFVRPKPLDEHDPYAASVVEAELLADDVIELLAAMQGMVTEADGVGSESEEVDDSVSNMRSQPEEHDSGEQPEEQPQPQPEEAESMEPEGRSENFAEQTSDDNGAEEDSWGGLSQREINQLLAGAADLESSDAEEVDNSVETVDEGDHF